MIIIMSLWKKLQKSASMKIAQNTAYQLIGKALGMLTTIPVSLVLANKFGAAPYGDFTKITTYVALFFIIGDFGLNAIYLQKASSDKAEKDLWSNLLGIRVLSSVGLMILTLIVLIFIPKGSDQGYTNLVRFGILLYTPVIIFQNLITTTNAVFQKRLRYDLAAWAIGVGGTAVIIMLYPLLLMVDGARAVIWATMITLIGTAVTALTGLFYVKKIFYGISIAFDWKKIKMLLFFALPLGLTTIVQFFYFRSDSLILTLTRSTAEVGIYALAYKVFEVVIVFPTFFINAVYPLMLKALNSDFPSALNSFSRIFKKSFLILFSISLAATLFLWIFAPMISLVKSDFIASIAPLRILALGLPVFFLTPLTMFTIISWEKQIWLLWIYFTAMLVNIILNLIFIPQYGYIAASWITVISEGLVLILSGIVVTDIFRKNKI